LRDPEHLRPDDPGQPVILLADDDVMVLNVVRITLEGEGYFLLTAEDGESAVELSKAYKGKIHMLLSDVSMPKMSGIQAANRITAERPGICVLLISGTFDEPNPGYPVLRKPFNTATLSETVNALLGRPSGRNEPLRVK